MVRRTSQYIKLMIWCSQWYINWIVYRRPSCLIIYAGVCTYIRRSEIILTLYPSKRLSKSYVFNIQCQSDKWWTLLVCVSEQIFFETDKLFSCNVTIVKIASSSFINRCRSIKVILYLRRSIMGCVLFAVGLHVHGKIDCIRITIYSNFLYVYHVKGFF